MNYTFKVFKHHHDLFDVGARMLRTVIAVKGRLHRNRRASPSSAQEETQEVGSQNNVSGGIGEQLSNSKPFDKRINFARFFGKRRATNFLQFRIARCPCDTVGFKELYKFD